jgi:hypothetical protein
VSNNLKDLKESANRLVVTRKPRTALPAPVVRAPIEAVVGFAEPQQPAAPSGVSGIASPLTETAFEQREYWAEQSITTSDGIFTLNIKRVKTIKFKDSRNAAVQLSLKQPV